MQLDLTDEETRALLNLQMETIENDRYPFSPRIQMLRQILAKFGELAPVPPPPARPPTPEERDPGLAAISIGTPVALMPRAGTKCAPHGLPMPRHRPEDRWLGVDRD